MPTYKTPNVYVEEVSTLPPSVVPVSTAIPAFLGCTEKAGDNNEHRGVPIRISSLLDYTTLFGGAYATEFTVALDADQNISQISAGDGEATTPAYLLYYALRMFFDNGGGSCYIVSIGSYEAAPTKDDFLDGLGAVRKEDEPTLLMLTDAVQLSEVDYYSVCQSALKQCNDLKDRFAIFDVLASDVTTNGIGANFRNNIGNEYLKYGAAYYPYLQTALNYHYTEASVSISGLADGGASQREYAIGGGKLIATYSGPASDNPRVQVTRSSKGVTEVAVQSGVLLITIPTEGETVANILAAAEETGGEIGSYGLAAGGETGVSITSSLSATPLVYATDTGTQLSSSALKVDRTALYNQIKAALDTMRVVLPPSSAIAGVYAKVDRERGVWKAPANVSLASVIGPTVKINSEEQEALNVDATAGKSINAIRSFTGKGTLVWGSRTLAGNDNEWRYIPVRRLFNLLEESIQKATTFVVFESNNVVTWLKVKTIIESYLDSMWRQGALSGTSQSEAFFVKVGLGQTMTEQDILEGRMIIEIGISAVRPAEFIILRFSHKLQQS